MAGGVSANRRLRARMDAACRRGGRTYYPRPEFCTDNGAMIAYAGVAAPAGRTARAAGDRPRARWPMEGLAPAAAVMNGDSPRRADPRLAAGVPGGRLGLVLSGPRAGDQVADIAAVTPEQQPVITICMAISSGSGQNNHTMAGASTMEISAASDEIFSTLAMNSQSAATPADQPVQAELHAERGGHALAAPEAEEHRVQVAEEGRQPRRPAPPAAPSR